eukprot:148539-Chlamydomonas_euryale.AAC.1
MRSARAGKIEGPRMVSRRPSTTHGEGHRMLLTSPPRKQGHRKNQAKCEVVRLRSWAAQHAT